MSTWGCFGTNLLIMHQKQVERCFKGSERHEMGEQAHCRHLLMFSAKTVGENLDLLRQSLANDLAPNIVKLLCMYFLWFGMKHKIKTDPFFFHQQYAAVNYFAPNMKKPIKIE